MSCTKSFTILPNSLTNNYVFKELTKQFFDQNSFITNSFRYYTKRPYTVIENHIYTALYYVDQNCIGYGHLDKDGETVWLGIAVSQHGQGNGFGTKIMKDLTYNYSSQITLSVDRDNVKAINLYQKFNFKTVDEFKNYFIMKN